jgi:hypothetical protein
MNALQAIRRYASQSLTGTIGNSGKAAAYVSGRVRVGGTGSNGYLGDWISGDAPGNVYNSSRYGGVAIPGTHINWDNITGEIISCPACQACLNWKARNRPQSPPMIEQYIDGDWQLPTKPHPFKAKLNRPNPFYDGDTLLNMTSFSLDTNGNAYIAVEYTNGGEIANLYWWPHNWVTIPPEYDEIVQSYILRNVLGKHMEVPAENVWHLKWGLDPEDWRFGMSPIAAVKRDIYSLQQSVNYRANIYRRMGFAGVIITPESANDVPNPETMKKLWNDRTRGDNAGSTVVLDFPAKVNFPGVTPQTMALETVEDRPEANICAVWGLSPGLVGLHAGRLAKTYANRKEEREAGWEECIMPENLLLSRQIGHNAFPHYITGERTPDAVSAYMEQYRLAFDYTDVRPLQPDKDKEHQRAREDWKANLINLAEWCQVVGRPEPPPELAEMRFRDLSTPVAMEEDEDEDEEEDDTEETEAQKAIRWDLRHLSELAEIDALEALHAQSAYAGNGVHA